jgi:hypothetical protein
MSAPVKESAASSPLEEPTADGDAPDFDRTDKATIAAGYANTARAHQARGWLPVPLAVGEKWPPPAGYTGRKRLAPSGADIQAWSEQCPGHWNPDTKTRTVCDAGRCNIAVVMPDGVIGIDVDQYPKGDVQKRGGETIAKAEALWGTLPAGPRTTRRHGDPVSGIRFFRVPAGLEFADVLDMGDTSDVEIIQPHHRYALVQGSTVDGMAYGHYDAELNPIDIPAVSELPELPDNWVQGLKVEPPKASNDDVFNVRESFTDGEPSKIVAAGLTAALTALQGVKGSRYDSTLKNTLTLMRHGRNGSPGVASALETLGNAYVAAVVPDRPKAVAIGEYKRMLFSPRAGKLLAEPSHQESWQEFIAQYPTATEAKAKANRLNGNGSTPNAASVEPETDEAATLLDSRIRTGTWLNDQHIEPLKYVVNGLLPVGSGYIVAPPKKGKSFLVAHIGLEVAKGGKVFGSIEVDKRPVLYLALEDGDRRLQVRFWKLTGDKQIPHGMNTIIRATAAEVLPMITAFIKRHPDALVILDTLGKIKPPRKPNQESYQADYEFGSRLKDAADLSTNACLWSVHHTRKMASDDFVDTMSGTQGLAGAADFVMMLKRERKSNEATLSVTGRDVVENEYALFAEDGIKWRLDGMDLTTAAAKVSEREDEKRDAGRTERRGENLLWIVAFVNSRPGQVTRRADAYQGAQGAGIGLSEDYCGKLLVRASKDNLITSLGNGLYQPLIEVC